MRSEEEIPPTTSDGDGDADANAIVTEKPQTRFFDSLRKTAFILGTAVIVIIAARNSITW